jgi:hypothetical protein
MPGLHRSNMPRHVGQLASRHLAQAQAPRPHTRTPRTADPTFLLPSSDTPISSFEFQRLYAARRAHSSHPIHGAYGSHRRRRIVSYPSDSSPSVPTVPDSKSGSEDLCTTTSKTIHARYSRIDGSRPCVRTIANAGISDEDPPTATALLRDYLSLYISHSLTLDTAGFVAVTKSKRKTIGCDLAYHRLLVRVLFIPIALVFFALLDSAGGTKMVFMRG